jgi:hypothetical protein
MGSHADPRRIRRSPLAWLRRPCGQSLFSLGAYLLAAVGLFGLRVLPHGSASYIGVGDRNVMIGNNDASAYMWSFVWWPHALIHGMNPLYTHEVWAPSGYSLTWGQTAPGASLLVWPITSTAGPVVAYNVLMVLAPALAAWTAFALCRHVTRAFWPSLLGGYVFGFSSYQLAQMTDHLNLSLVFPIPLVVLLVLRHLDGSLATGRFVGLLALSLLLLFSFSPELFLTTMLFGGLILLIGLAAASPPDRRRLLGTGAWSAVSCVLVGVAVSPYLIATWINGLPLRLNDVPRLYATDGLNLVLPTRIHLFGWRAFEPITSRFRTGLDEQGAYLGPLVVVVLWFTLRGKRGAAWAVLVGAFAAVTVCSLGSVLHIGGKPIIPMPWHLVSRVPVLRSVQPDRFMVYAWLSVALIFALWLSSDGRIASVKWAWALASMVLLLPNLSSSLWVNRVERPTFFSSGTYRQYLSPGENALVIPYAQTGFSMLWQAESHFYYRMAGGYLSYYVPPSFARCPFVVTLFTGRLERDSGRELKAFLAAKGVGAIIVQEGTSERFSPLFSSVGLRAVEVGGVRLYRVAPSLVASLGARPGSQSPRPPCSA